MAGVLRAKNKAILAAQTTLKSHARIDTIEGWDHLEGAIWTRLGPFEMIRFFDSVPENWWMIQ
jgi:hypothetical protein